MSEVTLRNWTIATNRYGIPYLLAHTVHNHPVIGSGRYGHSTALIWIDRERCIAQTLNTLYFLEEPQDDVNSPENQELIRKLHPENVPSEIRKAFGQRLPWPETDFDNDVVAFWNYERWTGERIDAVSNTE
ncbi:MAG: hypothetical protein ACPG1C_12340 [Alphaproteobacteria bacterium]